ncbi:hypothetical protein [Roseateles sp. L2-2]|uniref:hypothetical protein n=1 Tax=Roseateles sp. L2-2 TaxID=3422597 RepID=UPI003D36CE55
MSSLRLLTLGALAAIVVFGTTYRIGGLFLYPRAMMALYALWVLWREPRLRGLLKPLAGLLMIGVFALASAFGADEWRQLPIFLQLVVRGVALPYLAAIGLARLMGLTDRGDGPRTLTTHQSIQIVCLALVAQCAVSVAHLALPAFRTVYLEWVNLADTWRELAALGLPRFSGIGGISIYDTAIAYCVLGAALLLSAPRTSADMWLRALAVAIIMALCMLHGRTGMVFAAVLLGILAWQDVLNRRHQPGSVALRVGAGLGLLGVLAFVFVDEELRSYVLEFSGELFINLFAGDGLRSDSTDDFVENHLHLPDWETVLGGSGLWAQPDVAEAIGASYTTDSGYLLLLNFGGVPMVIVCVLALTWLLRGYVRSLQALGEPPPPDQVPARRWAPVAFYAYLATVIALVSWKGPIFLSEHCMTALFLVLTIGSRRGRSRC